MNPLQNLISVKNMLNTCKRGDNNSSLEWPVTLEGEIEFEYDVYIEQQRN